LSDKVLLLGKLPPFSNRRVLIDKKQSVYDIMREVLTAHRLFANDYDQIAADFWQGNVYSTAQFLFDFCKKYIPYKIENEDSQTTKSPAAILTLGSGDCKHYAGFIGGVLDALRRQGRRIDWAYRFAAYNGTGRTPEHVFIVVKNNGAEIWIDPVLKRFNERLRPSYYTDKKIMSLSRISGIGKVSFQDFPVNDVCNCTQFEAAIATLLNYGVMNRAGKVNEAAIKNLQGKNTAAFNEVTRAMQTIKNNAIGGFFDTLLRGIKKVLFAAPRAAFLSIVGINGFSYATKLKAAIYKADGTFTTFKDKIKDIWQNKFGGDFSALLNTVNAGANKPAILGITPAVVTAWVGVAAAVIAAIMPLVKSFLSSSQNNTQLGLGYNIDPSTGLPYTTPQPTNSIVDWITRNPVLVIGGIAAVYLYTTQKKGAA